MSDFGGGPGALPPAPPRDLPPGAMCAEHPDAAATAVCARCGNFMCLACSDGGRRTCRACRERAGVLDFAITRDRFEVGAVLNVSWEAFRVAWVPLTLASLLLLAVNIVFGVAGELVQIPVRGREEVESVVSIAVSVMQQIAQAPLVLGLTYMAIRALRGQPVELAHAFTQLDKLGKLIVQWLVVGGILGVPLVLFVAIPIALEQWILALAVVLVLTIPLVYVALGLACAQMELVFDDDCGAVEAIRRSWLLASGWRLPMFGLHVVAMFVLAAGLLACCVGLAPAEALFYVILSAMYLGLRNGSGLPEPRER